MAEPTPPRLEDYGLTKESFNFYESLTSAISHSSFVIGGVIGAIKIAFSGLAFVMANPVILGAIALIGAPIGIAIGAGKLAEFIEKKVAAKIEKKKSRKNRRN